MVAKWRPCVAVNFDTRGQPIVRCWHFSLYDKRPADRSGDNGPI